MRNLLIGILLLALSAIVIAQTTVPYAFTQNTPARATEVNADFQALATAIDNLSSRVSRLEGTVTAANIAGSYTLAGLQVNSYASSASSQIDHAINRGDFTLNADKTFSYSGTYDQATARTTYVLGPPTGGNRAVYDLSTTVARDNAGQSGSGTWDISGNTLTLTFAGGNPGSLSFIMAAGPSLFVSASVNNSNSNASLALDLFIRVQ